MPWYSRYRAEYETAAHYGATWGLTEEVAERLLRRLQRLGYAHCSCAHRSRDRDLAVLWRRLDLDPYKLILKHLKASSRDDNLPLAFEAAVLASQHDFALALALDHLDELDREWELMMARAVPVRIDGTLRLLLRRCGVRALVSARLAFDDGTFECIEIPVVRYDGALTAEWQNFLAAFDGVVMDADAPWCARLGRLEALAVLDEGCHVRHLLPSSGRRPMAGLPAIQSTPPMCGAR